MTISCSWNRDDHILLLEISVLVVEGGVGRSVE